MNTARHLYSVNARSLEGWLVHGSSAPVLSRDPEFRALIDYCLVAMETLEQQPMSALNSGSREGAGALLARTEQRLGREKAINVRTIKQKHIIVLRP